MRIIVCIKEVSEWGEGKAPAGVVVRVNPQDLIALEEALLLRERLGGEVIALSLGVNERALRRTLTSGADIAVLVEDTKPGQRDWYTTSFILAQAARRIDFDLILCGTRRPDDMDGVVGTGIAEHLKLPVVTNAVKIEVSSRDSKTARISKKLPRGIRETYELSLPCVVTVEEGLNQPRYIPISGRCYFQGLARPVEHMTMPELGITLEALSPKTTTLDISEFRPRTRFGVKLTGLSLQEKLRLLTGASRTGDKRETIDNDPQKAADRLLEKLAEWSGEERR